MDHQISKLKNDFNAIIDIRSNIQNIFDVLQIRINKLKSIYGEFISHNKNHLFIFGLDSFHFQSKIIDIEFDDMKRIFLAINNRLYCEYYKLYKLITEYVAQQIQDKKLMETIHLHNFPVYKDTEPYRDYKFEKVQEIHGTILELLNSIVNILNDKEHVLQQHKNKRAIGLNIDNFISSYNFELNVMREKIHLFLTYIEFFHNLHTKYLKRFSNKIKLMYIHIDNDVKFDETIEINHRKISKPTTTIDNEDTNSSINDGSDDIIHTNDVVFDSNSPNYYNSSKSAYLRCSSDIDLDNYINVDLNNQHHEYPHRNIDDFFEKNVSVINLAKVQEPNEIITEPLNVEPLMTYSISEDDLQKREQYERK